MPSGFREISRSCKKCGTGLILKNSRDIVRKWFCSHSCRASFYITEEVTKLAQSKANTPEANAKKGHKKESHPNWKNDRSKLAFPRSRAEFKWWREKIFTRDDYTCSECGQRGLELQAHHKAPVSVFSGYKFELWNGITVCKECHKKIHLAANEIFRTGGYFNRLKENQIAIS